MNSNKIYLCIVSFLNFATFSCNSKMALQTSAPTEVVSGITSCTAEAGYTNEPAEIKCEGANASLGRKLDYEVRTTTPGCKVVASAAVGLVTLGEEGSCQFQARMCTAKTCGDWSKEFTITSLGEKCESATLTFSESATYDFGPTFVGSTYEKTITLTNSGTCAARNLKNSGLIAPFSFKGSVFPGTGGTCTTKINSGDSCTIVVAASPIGTGIASSTLSISYNQKSTSLAFTASQINRKIVSRSRTGTNSFRELGSYFGKSVAVSSDTMVVGASNDSMDSAGKNNAQAAGSVYVYKRTGTSWALEQKLSATGLNARLMNDSFGVAVAIDGDTIAVGSRNTYDQNGENLGGAGAVFVYSRTNSVWTLQQRIVPTGTNARSVTGYFGSSVAISGNTLIAGAYLHGYDENGANSLSNSGAAFIFTRTGSTWTQQQKIVGSGTNGRAASDYFGYAVAIDGDIAAVGASSQQYDESGLNQLAGAGAVYMFVRASGVWTLQQKIVATGTSARNSQDRFGTSVALFGTTVAVGAPNHKYDETGAAALNYAGAVFVFKQSGTTWPLEQKIVGSGTNGRLAFDYFGTSVSLTTNTLIVGSTSNGYDENGANLLGSSGAAFIFDRVTTTWTLTQKIVPQSPSTRTAASVFGNAVAISGSTAVVGAYNHTSDETGAAIDPVGAAFAFKLTTGVWSQQKQVLPLATNTARISGDNFARVLSVSGNTMAIAAPFHPYDQNDSNFLYRSGAVYIYTRSGTAWSLQQKIVPTGLNARQSGSYFGNGLYSGIYGLALDGDTLAVGMPNNSFDEAGSAINPEVGGVFVFKRTGTTWSLEQKLIPQGANAAAGGEKFGAVVTLHQNTIAVGVPFSSYDETGSNYINSAGAVFVFTRNGSTWTQQQRIVATGTNARTGAESFGRTLALQNDDLVVGSTNSYDENGTNNLAGAGSVFVLKRTGTTWSQTQKLVATGTNARLAADAFGSQVAIDGNTIVVGAPSQDYDAVGGNMLANAGSAFVYTRSNGVWSQSQKIAAPLRAAGDRFGASIAVSGNFIAVGAPSHALDELNENSKTNAGAVYVLKKSTENLWSVFSKLAGFGLNGRSADYANFGANISFQGGTLGIGVQEHGYNEVGDEYVPQAGAAFVWDGFTN